MRGEKEAYQLTNKSKFGWASVKDYEDSELFAHSDDELPHEGDELSREAKLDKVKKVETAIKFSRSIKPPAATSTRGKKSYPSPSPASSTPYKRRSSYGDERGRPDYWEGADRRVLEFRSHLDKIRGNCYVCKKTDHQAKSCPDRPKK